jgi:hypothetical protein
MHRALQTRRPDLRWMWFAKPFVVLILSLPGVLVCAQDCHGNSCLPLGLPAITGSTFSGPAVIGLLATLPATLTLSISSVDLNIPVTDPTAASAVVSVPVSSSWTLNSSTTNVELVAYFDSPQRRIIGRHSTISMCSGDAFPLGVIS